MVLNAVKLICYIDNVVVRQDSCNSLITGIGFYNGLQGMIKLRKDSGG